MCDVLWGRESRDVRQSARGGRESKLAKNSVMYFMGGPQLEKEEQTSGKSQNKLVK